MVNVKLPLALNWFVKMRVQLVNGSATFVDASTQ